MKKTNMLMGASALILAVAGAFTSRATKIDHQSDWGTKDSGVSPSGLCHAHMVAINSVVTKSNSLGGRTRLTRTVNKNSNLTVFTHNCVNTLFTILN